MNPQVESRQRRRSSYRRRVQPAQGSADVAGLRVMARCVSAEPELRMGGDWYLVMPLPGGGLLLAVGDATGHGLAAVPGMLRLRGAMAALAAQDSAPAAVLHRLNTLAGRDGLTAAASAVVARYQPATAELTWARAGHPPVVIVGPRGATTLEDPGGPLLGIDPRAVYRPATRRIGENEQVLLHTDGFYRRGQTVDEWAEELTGRWRDQPSLLDCLEYGAAGDDACALVARRL